jgi:hypothetical protein
LLSFPPVSAVAAGQCSPWKLRLSPHNHCHCAGNIRDTDPAIVWAFTTKKRAAISAGFSHSSNPFSGNVMQSKAWKPAEVAASSGHCRFLQNGFFSQRGFCRSRIISLPVWFLIRIVIIIKAITAIFAFLAMHTVLPVF